MSDQEAPAPNLLDTVFGYAPAQIIHVAARLGIADQLADGALTSTEVAAATETHPPSMYRILRALACLGVVTEVEPDGFELTAAGASLRSAAPDSIRALVMLFCGDEVWRSWGELEYSVRTGKPAWEHVTGVSSFEFLRSTRISRRRSTRRWPITRARLPRRSSPATTSPSSARWSTSAAATAP